MAYIRNAARRHYNDKKIKVGHSGTLDPFATGLLLIGLGRDATKQLDKFKNLPKTYIAKITLGVVSDTYDSTGKITVVIPTSHSVIPAQAGIQENGIDSRFRGNDMDKRLKPNKKEIKKTLKQFIGQQEQIPPMYSAKKVKGKKLYELARRGIEVKREPHKIEIYKIKLLEYNYPRLKIEVKCSVGTYIRALAHDIGQGLGVGAYCSELTRTKIGHFNLKKAFLPRDVNLSKLIDKSLT